MARWALLSLVVLALCAGSTSARTFDGAIAVTQVGTPATAYESIPVSGNASIEQQCDPGLEYCGYYTIVTTVAASQACAPTITASSWVGDVYDETTAPGSKALTPTWSEWPSTYAGLKRACLYAEFGGEALVAETTYTVPSPPSSGGGGTAVDYDCADFTYQEDAQQYLLPGDPYRLDGDDDGIACEGLPHRPTTTTNPAEAPEPEPEQPRLFVTRREAASVARTALAKRFGRTWTRGSSKRVRCRDRISSTRVRCVATWRRKSFRYRATVLVQERTSSYRTVTRLTRRVRV